MTRLPISRPRRPPSRAWLAAAAWAALTGSAWAQAAGADWTRGTTLNAFGGLGVDGARTAGAAGGALGWEVTPRLAIEGTGTWLARGRGADGFAADLAALLHLTQPRRVMPFVKGGIGLYRASFDPTRSPMPAFYRNRLGQNAVFDRHAIFTDPALVAGGGFTGWLSRNVSVRPEVDLKIVVHGGRAHPMAVAGVRVGYHFVDYPIESRTR